MLMDIIDLKRKLNLWLNKNTIIQTILLLFFLLLALLLFNGEFFLAVYYAFDNKLRFN
jgi:hypothetical protein